MKDTVQVDIERFDVRDGDLFLLCSDGLSGMVHDDALMAAVTESADLEAICTKLIEMANAAGGNDNITCILVRYFKN
jgi:protein phosphatase